MEAMGPGTLRAMGETRRTGLRGRRREAVRRAALRRPQGVEPALAVLRLSRRYSERRLENACSLALQSVASPRYSHIRPILETGQDMTGGLTETSDDGAGGWVRGGDYYANMGR